MEQFAKYGKFLTEDMIAELAVPIEDNPVLTDALILRRIYLDSLYPAEGTSLVQPRWRDKLIQYEAMMIPYLLEADPTDTFPGTRDGVDFDEPVQLIEATTNQFSIYLDNLDPTVAARIRNEFSEYHRFIGFLYVVEDLANNTPSE